MVLKYCMNIACGASSALMEWRRGWMLQSGDFADLCDKCGDLYETSNFCEVFHSNDPGWRQCIFCNKNIHCGCIASLYLYELHDTYGVSCVSCAGKPRHQPVIEQSLSILKGNQVVTDSAQHVMPQIVSPLHMGSSISSGSSLGQTLGAVPLTSIPFHGAAAAVVDGRESILQRLKFRPVLPKFPMPGYASRLEANNASMKPRTSASKAAHRSWERDQKSLARYRPQMTDEELQQISGNSNSTVVPLFEKVLTASDAGPIGRIVLPKACAEVYLPPISEAEGIPFEIHDVNGNVWKVQFKFWFNSNSRMYVLEGARPCIESMQLKAGDTVTLNRMEPEGKIIMWVRRKLQSSPIAAQSPNGMNKRLKIESHDDDSKQKVLSVIRGALVKGLRFEEHEDSPTLGPRSIFLALANRVIERWTTCDDCSRWRKVPTDVFLPPEWTCMDNIWDQNRSSCSAPNELNPMDLENLLIMIHLKGSRKEVVEASPEPALEDELFSDLHNLADVAAVIKDSDSNNQMNQNKNQMMQEMNHQSKRDAGTFEDKQSGRVID